MIVTICGHKEILWNDEDKKHTKDVLYALLCASPNTLFYLGDDGAFDRACNHILKGLQRDFPKVKRIFVTPYLDPDYLSARNADETYDEVVYPFCGNVPPRYAISKRNAWMVDHADLVIARVDHEWGGAAKTLRLALQKQKRFVNLGKYCVE